MESTRKLCACGCSNPTMRQNKYLPGHKKATSSASRYWAKIDKTETCWLWTASLSPQGYARHFHDGEVVAAHRHAYAMEHGPIPEGQLIDHICGVKRCVNPTHLRLANAAQNAENTGLRANNKSGFRGVYFDNRLGKYVGKARHKGKVYHAGVFNNAEEAGQAAKELRLKLFTHNVLDRKDAA